MNKEIEEMADDIYWKGSRFDILTKSGCEDLAETLYDLGYHKTVWHKAADGDLPPIGHLVLTIYEDIKGSHYATDYITFKQSFNNTNHIEAVWRSNLYDKYYDLKEVIAWTEVPKYKE